MDFSVLDRLAAAAGLRPDDLSSRPPGQPPLDEVMVTELKMVAERYFAGCPFRAGDIVTPRPGYNTRGVGYPAIVVEVRHDEDASDFATLPWTCEPENTCSTHYARRLDMRVISYDTQAQASIVPFWVESWQYEPYPSAETEKRLAKKE